MSAYKTRSEQRVEQLESLPRPLTDQESDELRRALHAVYERQRRIARTCSVCAKPLSDATLRNIAKGRPTTGKCGDCARDASRAAKRHCSDCGVQVSHMSLLGRCRPCAAKARGPEFEQKRVEAVRQSVKRPEMLALKQAVARRNAAMRIAWCPEDRRAEYRRLRRQVGAEQASAEIISRLSPFERQLALVASGKARIVDVVRIPSRGFERSLTGNAAAMMVAA